jgi:ADP-ribose pyrophosphatase YjhB (NUDIX family)
MGPMPNPAKPIDELVPPDAPQGAGVFCRVEANRYLFALYDESRLGNRRLVCGRIGGRRHEGETWRQCVEREVIEETGCHAVVESSPQCFYADIEGQVEEVAVEADPRPALISRQPAAGAIIPGGIYYNLCFWARLLGKPKPGAELDALLVIDEPLLRRLAGESFTLAELVAAGATLIPARDLDPDMPVILGRSTEVLLAILDRTAL